MSQRDYREMYTSGEYFEKNPSWHTEDSAWKAGHIARILEQNSIEPKTVIEVGCGAGEVLSQLQQRLDKACAFHGYEISPQAFELCQQRANDRLSFSLKDILEVDVVADVVLIIDLIEHLDDYLGFLRKVKSKGHYKVFHIPLELSMYSILRSDMYLKGREAIGHIHYFTKNFALAVLRDTGYEVLDHFYTAPFADLHKPDALASRIARWVRVGLFSLNEDFLSRTLGATSLMVLTK
jgi:SAM-dependent methyltransferase